MTIPLEKRVIALEQQVSKLTDALLKTVETCRDMAAIMGNFAQVMSGEEPWNRG